jgi:hypothetical protein
VFGRSLGGAVAVHLAFQPFYARHIAVLMLENTFTSLPDIGRTIFDFPILQYYQFHSLWFDPWSTALKASTLIIIQREGLNFITCTCTRF